MKELMTDIVATKKSKTFIQERKRVRQVDSVIKNLSDSVYTHVALLTKISIDEKTPPKDKVIASKTVLDLYKDLIIERNNTEVERLKMELEYAEQLLAESKTEGTDWEDDDDDYTTPYVDFTQVIPVKE